MFEFLKNIYIATKVDPLTFHLIRASYPFLFNSPNIQHHNVNLIKNKFRALQ